MLREDVGTKGYVVRFEGLIKYIGALLLSAEVINGALRENQLVYLVLAIREIMAKNTLIYQNLTISGTGQSIEKFSDRCDKSWHSIGGYQTYC